MGRIGSLVNHKPIETEIVANSGPSFHHQDSMSFYVPPEYTRGTHRIIDVRNLGACTGTQHTGRRTRTWLTWTGTAVVGDKSAFVFDR